MASVVLSRYTGTLKNRLQPNGLTAGAFFHVVNRWCYFLRVTGKPMICYSTLFKQLLLSAS